MQISGLSTVRKLKEFHVVIQAMSQFFKFTLNFRSPVSFMTHNHVKFSSWNIILLLSKYAIFQTLSALMKVHPIPHVIFRNYKVIVYSNFASLFSAMKDNSCIFSLRTEELCLMELNIDNKFGEKLARASKIDMINLANFHESTWVSKFHRHFHGILLSKVETVRA